MTPLARRLAALEQANPASPPARRLVVAGPPTFDRARVEAFLTERGFRGVDADDVIYIGIVSPQGEPKWTELDLLSPTQTDQTGHKRGSDRELP